MKKVFEYLAIFSAAAFVAFSCKPLPEDNSHVEEVVKAPAVNITVSEITDYTAKVTISPAGAANYYAYVVDKSDSDDSASLDAASLYANKYSSVSNGLVKYATANSTTIELEKLNPNTTYQVYAVAGSTTGVVGEIANASFLTTDAGTPTPGTPSKKENVITVKFSESVTYDESKPADAIYYAYNTAVIGEDESGKTVVLDNGAVDEAKVDVSVSGSTVTFTVTLDGTNPLPDGAYYTIAYPAGAFVDAVGNPCPAQSHLTGLTQSGTLGFGGIYGRVSTKAFDLVVDAEKEIVIPTEDQFNYPVPEGVDLYDYTEEAKATITVEKSSASKTSTTVYTLEEDVTWGYLPSEKSIALFYPFDIDIEGGDYVTFDIAEGSVEDIYGNTNTAVSQKCLYSFNYDLEEFYGTYTFTGLWYNHGKFANTEVIIAPREPFEDEETEEYYADRNVAIYNLFKVNPSAETLTSFENYETVHYGTFNVDTGFLNIEYEYEGEGTLASYEWEGTVLIFNTDGDNYNFFQGTAGTLELQDDLRVYLDGLGTWGWYEAGSTLVKTGDDYTLPVAPTIAKASVSAKKTFSKGPKDIVVK